MATANYSYEKRQRELAKKRKKEEKLQRKTGGKPAGSAPDTGEAPVATGVTDGGTTPSGDPNLLP